MSILFGSKHMLNPAPTNCAESIGDDFPVVHRSLLTIQRRLRCGFAQFKLCAHFLDLRCLLFHVGRTGRAPLCCLPRAVRIPTTSWRAYLPVLPGSFTLRDFPTLTCPFTSRSRASDTRNSVLACLFARSMRLAMFTASPSAVTRSCRPPPTMPTTTAPKCAPTPILKGRWNNLFTYGCIFRLTEWSVSRPVRTAWRGAHSDDSIPKSAINPSPAYHAIWPPLSITALSM